MKTSHFSKDIQDFLELLYRHRVKHVIVGGEEVIFYGWARLTGDVDFFFGTFEENTKCLYDTLNEFWGGNIPGVDSFEELMEPGIILQFGVPPNRIDLVNHIDGVTFGESWAGKKIISMNISGRSFPVYYIGLDQLIANKEAIGRPKDLEDLKYLRKTKEDNPS